MILEAKLTLRTETGDPYHNQERIVELVLNVESIEQVREVFGPMAVAPYIDMLNHYKLNWGKAEKERK